MKRATPNLNKLSKKHKTQETNLLQTCLEESGLMLKHPPNKCIATEDTVHIVRNIKRYLQKQINYPHNSSELVTCLTKECDDVNIFKHYLYPNILKQTEETTEEHPLSDSVIKVLLSVPVLQSKLIEYIFERAMDFAVENKCGPWIQMILKCVSTLDCITCSDKISSNLINLLDVTTEKMVKLEIIVAIPDMVQDQDHETIANEMSRILSEDQELIPAVLDCLTYLYLTDEQYAILQKKTLNIVATLPKGTYFPNFIKFLLIPGRVTDAGCFDIIQGLRNAIGWPISAINDQETATNQVLTAAAIRSTMISSKIVSSSWIKTINTCKLNTDHKPIDIVILLILYTISEEKQKQVETIIKKQVKNSCLTEEILDEAVTRFKPIFKEYLRHVVDLSNTLLKLKTDPLLESFATRIYTVIFSELDDCRQTIIAELLQLGLDRKQCVMSILIILNNIAKSDLSLLKPQSLQMLILLDRTEGMSLSETRSVMNLLCGLSYSFENSIIRDDIHMIIRKELGSSNPTVKVQGILAGVHAVKYLMASTENEENTINLPDDVSYSSFTYLSEGPLREAAQIIELISRSTRQFPDLIAFFYDELSEIVSHSDYINKHFLSWLTDAVTNDLQQNFIIDSPPTDKFGPFKLSMQYCLNADSEMDEIISINIAGLCLQTNEEIYIGILSPLFQLIQSLHYKQHEGDLSSIDALLGCGIIMPLFDMDLIEDMDNNAVINLLNCLVHCVNWFRELLNAFALQDDEVLKVKLLSRIVHIEELETFISSILLKCPILYKPPICTFDISKYSSQEQIPKKIKLPISKVKPSKPNVQGDDTVLPETVKTHVPPSVKNKIEMLQNMPFRNLSIKLLNLFNNKLSSSDSVSDLNFKTFKYLLKWCNHSLESILISKIKRNTFLSNINDTVYDPHKAEECVKCFNEVLPKILEHLNFTTSVIDEQTSGDGNSQEDILYTPAVFESLDCLESIYKMLTIYFKWIGFKQHHTALLKISLNILDNKEETSKVVSLKDLVLSVIKVFQTHDKYCLQMSTALSLIDLLGSILEFSETKININIIKNMANNFLSQQWKTSDGAFEKGLAFNQSVDRLAAIYLLNSEITVLKKLTLQLTSDIQTLKGRNDTLSIWKCVNKSNFTILYKNLGIAVHDSAKNRLSKGLTNTEHLELWKDVVILLKYMSEIAKTLENRNNLCTFFKKCLPIIKLFLSQGIPIIELEFKTNTQEVLEILKILQQSTRFLQSLCCHSRLKKDTALLSKVPLMREMLETLIYKVKAALAANNCSEAFWMGNLKNKNIHGEVIASQQSIESEETVEDDENLPEDVESDDSDEDLIDPESKSYSDIV